MTKIPFTEAQKRALDLFRQKENLFISGYAGTGKSTVVKEILQIAKEEKRNVLCAAPTGIAASLIGGRTLHSSFLLHPGLSIHKLRQDQKSLKDRAGILERYDLLIIDEISMVNSSLLAFIVACMQCGRWRPQICLIGDFAQLPPVKGNYAFQCPEWNSLNLKNIFLHKPVRQNNEAFIQSLNQIRMGDPSCRKYFFENSAPHWIDGAITLCTRRREAEAINKKQISALPGEERVYPARYDGNPDIESLQIERELVVKKGMRVMCLVNGDEYSNGSMGTITDMGKDLITVLFDSGKRVSFKRCNFEAEQKVADANSLEALPLVTISQFPLKPAYAVTIHKSQGQTFPAANLLLDHCWEAGQLYVALSRVIDVKKMYFIKRFSERDIIVDQTVQEFYRGLAAQAA